MRRFASRLALLASLTTLVAAQGEGGKPPQLSSSSLLLRVRSVNATLDVARDVAYELSQRAITVRIQFCDLLAKRYRQALRDFADSRQKLHDRMREAVPKTQRRLQHTGGTAEVESLREQCLAISRGRNLTKQRIHDELDPMVLRLRALTLPTPAAVLETDESLSERIDALRDEHDTVQGWWDLYSDTLGGLRDDKVGKNRLEQRHLKKQNVQPEPPLIDTDFELLCLMALPMSDRDSKTLLKNDELRAAAVAEEFAGTLELNRIRLALGLSLLRIDEKLGNAARDHSSDMRTLDFFSHTSPVEGKRSPGDRASRAGTSGGAENIAAGHATGAGAIRAWWYSPGHHRNMLGSHARTGLGQSGRLWTQMFGG